MQHLCVQLAQYNKYLISTVDMEGISSHSAKYKLMHFLAFKA